MTRPIPNKLASVVEEIRFDQPLLSQLADNQIVAVAWGDERAGNHWDDTLREYDDNLEQFVRAVERREAMADEVAYDY